MAAPTPEAIENARRKVEQAKARLQALEARAATLNRKADARRKIILGGLLLDAAMKDPAWESRLNDLMARISRDQDRKAFDGLDLQGRPRRCLIRSTPPSSTPPPPIPARIIASCSMRCGRPGPMGSRSKSPRSSRRSSRTPASAPNGPHRQANGVDALHRAAGQLQRVSGGVWWDRLKEWITAALIGLGLIFAAALAYRWAQEPKIERHYTDAPHDGTPKPRRAKGKWVPLQAQ
jgi:hypothetical protein